ncbi:hypothetical protein [uncultured Sphingomonas sp.]|uniref:hypothetical protein n=1 Tax=uncultured Sphingomonas sp. TaxID=158754 RepID=UPI0035CAA3B5
MNRLRRSFLLAATGLTLAGATACSRSEPEADPANIETAAEPGVAMNLPGIVETQPAAPAQPSADTNAAAELPPEAAAAPDEQMLDDASATGMTARAARGEDDAPAANMADD